MKLPGCEPGEFHLPEKRLKETACGADNVRGAEKWRAAGIKTRVAQTNAAGAEKDCGTDKYLRDFLSAIKYPLFRAFPPHKKPRR